MIKITFCLISQYECIYMGEPIRECFVWVRPYFLRLCAACLARLIWGVLEIGSKWRSSCCSVECCFQNLIVLAPGCISVSASNRIEQRKNGQRGQHFFGWEAIISPAKKRVVFACIAFLRVWSSGLVHHWTANRADYALKRINLAENLLYSMASWCTLNHFCFGGNIWEKLFSIDFLYIGNS